MELARGAPTRILQTLSGMNDRNPALTKLVPSGPIAAPVRRIKEELDRVTEVGWPLVDTPQWILVHQRVDRVHVESVHHRYAAVEEYPIKPRAIQTYRVEFVQSSQHGANVN